MTPEQPLPSVTRTVKVKLPLTVGVPLMAFDEVRLSPGGSEPLAIPNE